MRFVQVKDNTIVGSPFPRPQRWKSTTLGNASADTLRNLGLWPVKTDDPGPSSDLQERNGTSLNLDKTKGVVVETVEYADRPLDDMKAVVREKVLSEYQRQLKAGFTDSTNGYAWKGTQEARNVMLELASGLGSNDRMPKGQSSVTLRDATGTPHSLTKSEVQSLANDALDFKWDADNRRTELLDQIEAATDKSDLPSDIDIASGWP